MAVRQCPRLSLRLDGTRCRAASPSPRLHRSYEIPALRIMKLLQSQAPGIRLNLAQSLLLAHALYFHVWAAQGRSTLAAISIFAVLSLAAFALLWWPSRQFAEGLRSRAPSQWLFSLAAFLLCGWLLTYTLPVPPAPVGPGPMVSVTVQALGEKATQSSGSEVWVRLEADGEPVPLSAWSSDGGWIEKEGMIVATGAARLTWRGAANDIRLSFLHHPWSGRASFQAGSRSEALDLYAEQADTGIRQVWNQGGTDAAHLHFPQRSTLQRWVQVTDAVLIGLLLWLAFEWLVSRHARTQPDRQTAMWRECLSLAAPMLACWGLMLLIFYPGVMTPDSIDQWHQSASRSYSDWHPAYHTLAITAIRHLWDSPAAVATLQASALAFSLAWLIASVRRVVGAPSLSAHFAAWLCALNPFLCLTSITLWKDVPYASSLIAVSAICINLIWLRRIRLRSWLSFIVVAAIMLACMLLRHNGAPVVAGVLIVLLAILHGQRKQVALLAIAVLGCFVALKGPVADAIGVRKAHAVYALASHHIASHLARGELPERAQERELLTQIGKGTLRWPYNCATVDATIFSSQFDGPIAAANTAALLEQWARLAMRNPETEIEHVRCASSLVWLMTESPQDPAYHYLYGVYPSERGIRWIADMPTPDSGGLHEASKLPDLVPMVWNILPTPSRDLVWRPASYLFALFFALAVAVRRRRDWRLILIAFPIALHSAVLAAVSVAQDVRYQLAAIALSAATVPCLMLSNPRTEVSAAGESKP